MIGAGVRRGAGFVTKSEQASSRTWACGILGPATFSIGDLRVGSAQDRTIHHRGTE